MVLRVQYLNFGCADVDVASLEKLLEEKKLRRFYRPSEKRWVNVSTDPIRGMGGNYSGPERRHSHRHIHFDPWYTGLWTWIWIAAAIMGVMFGVVAD
jgi:hypothetical protein